MTIEKILVGDDRIDFAKKVFPTIPNTEVEFVDNPNEVISRALTEEYSTIVTDLMYTPAGQEGFEVLEKIKDLDARKILWTGNAYDEGVRERARSLGAETLDKDEIGSLVGTTVSKAPLKKDGMVLIYCQNEEGVLYKSMKKVSLILGKDRFRMGSNLEEELSTNKYGLVIDTTTMQSQGDNPNGVVAHDMRYMELEEVPRVVCLHNVTTALTDIAMAGSKFYSIGRKLK